MNNCYVWSNSSQREYMKIMIEIQEECARFQTTSQRLTDQIKAIKKKG